MFNLGFRKSIRVDGEASWKPNLNVKRVDRGEVIIRDINHAPAVSTGNVRIFYQLMSAVVQRAYTVSNVLCMYAESIVSGGNL